MTARRYSPRQEVVPMKALTVRISDELHTKLRYAAVDHRTSLQGVCVMAFEEFLQKHPQQREQVTKKGARR
jgi:hypothetical protein